jgi:hypothetical protein
VLTEEGQLQALSSTLSAGYKAIILALSTLREGRSSLTRVAHDKLLPAHAKLLEATDATEIAVSGLMDDLDAAVAIIDRLDEADDRGSKADAAVLRTTLREKLFEMMGRMQFQDITRQQIAFTSDVLLDTEHRLAQIATAFNPASAEVLPDVPRYESLAGTYDPHATMKGSPDRQAGADSVFTAAATVPATDDR